MGTCRWIMRYWIFMRVFRAIAIAWNHDVFIYILELHLLMRWMRSTGLSFNLIFSSFWVANIFTIRWASSELLSSWSGDSISLNHFSVTSSDWSSDGVLWFISSSNWVKHKRSSLLRWAILNFCRHNSCCTHNFWRFYFFIFIFYSFHWVFISLFLLFFYFFRLIRHISFRFGPKDTIKKFSSCLFWWRFWRRLCFWIRWQLFIGRFLCVFFWRFCYFFALIIYLSLFTRYCQRFQIWFS